MKRIGFCPMKSTRLFRILRDLILLFVIRFRSMRSNVPALKTFLLGRFQDYLRIKLNINFSRIVNLFNFRVVFKVVSGNHSSRSRNFLNLFNLDFVQLPLIIVRDVKITNLLLKQYLSICLKGREFITKVFPIRFKAGILSFISLNNIHFNEKMFKEFLKKFKSLKVSVSDFRLLKLKNRKINFKSLGLEVFYANDC